MPTTTKHERILKTAECLAQDLNLTGLHLVLDEYVLMIENEIAMGRKPSKYLKLKAAAEMAIKMKEKSE